MHSYQTIMYNVFTYYSTECAKSNCVMFFFIFIFIGDLDCHIVKNIVKKI